MTDFFVKVPDDKVAFFKELLLGLGYEYEQLSAQDEELNLPGEDEYFTDADD